MGDKFSIPAALAAGRGRAGRRDAAAGRDAGRLGRRLGQTGANPRAGRIYSADRLRAAGHRRGEGFDQNMASPVASKEASWAAVRDKLVAGELDAAHILYGLLYGLELGIASKPQAMAIDDPQPQWPRLPLQRAAGERGDRPRRAEAADRPQRAGQLHLRPYLPTGTHAMWLYYWLASAGIDPSTMCAPSWCRRRRW